MNDGYSRRYSDPHHRRPRANGIGSRPDRVALWAVFLALAAMLAAAASSHGSSGGIGDPAASGTACAADASFGQRALRVGDCGADVRTLNWILNAKSFGTAAPLGQRFEDSTERAVRSYQRRAGIDGSGVVDTRTRAVLIEGMGEDVATWYGPGFYGNETACGQTLTRRTVGVAHKSLPCGAKVTIKHRGRFLRTRVIDRGPFARGAKWDLTGAAARRLGIGTTTTIRTAIVR